MAIVYASWPEEDSDPWLQIESRVAQMVDAKFDAARRKRLGDRLRRYVKQFSRCAQAWVSDGLVKFNGLSLPKHIVDEKHIFAGTTGVVELDIDKTTGRYPAPPCTQQLEGHMSLERDEWFRTENGQMSALFMPFANMHTQLLSMLTDHPFSNDMNWKDSLQTTAAEYGDYMLSHLLAGWKAQACRTIRLRHSMSSPGSYKYQFVVLKPVYQPNAAEDCSKSCGSQSGWCDWCGGTNNGACCKQGDGGVCARFDPPIGYHTSSKYSACVSTDCIQTNTVYYGSDLKEYGEADMQEYRERSVEKEREPVEYCQHMCRELQGSVFFTFSNGGKKCLCHGGQGAKRYNEKGSSSGPVNCKNARTIKMAEDEIEEKLNQTNLVPMDQAEPCIDQGLGKSAAVSNVGQLEEKYPSYVKECLYDATEVALKEYNVFYKRFAEFVDMLAWKAGCGAQHQYDWSYSAKDGDGMAKVSDQYDAGSFGDCDWEKEEAADKKIKWVYNEESARGWTKTSRVNMDEQAKVKTQYPMPSWLHDLKAVHPCLKRTAAGNVAEDGMNNGISTGVAEAMGPAAVDPDAVQTTDDPEFDNLLQQELRV
jgi:hypothetical protein